jgi:pimeloyl-ACP methyl ester carboxylesterase
MKTNVDETELAWEESGTGTPLLLIHGLPFQKGMWKPQLSALSKKFRVIAIDLPGFGESGAPRGEASMPAYADLIAAFCNSLRLDSLVLAGHSMGGYIALEFAARHPALLRGLVMVSSRAIADTADVAANRRVMAERLKTEPADFVAEAMLPKMLASDNRDLELRRQVRELMNPLRPEGIAHAQLAIATRRDFSAKLREIDTPALVVAGEKDMIAPLEEAGIIAANFRHGRLEVVENAGHMVSWEQPKAVNAALEKWALSL